MASDLENDYEKHPLEHTWNLWLINDINKNLWKVNLQNLAEFNTVEDYWCFYHHTKLPSELEDGQDYAVFKKGTSPRWEDELHCDGGRWFINMQRRKRDLDVYWLDVVLLMIGENFGEANDIISGAVVSVRKTVNKISLALCSFGLNRPLDEKYRRDMDKRNVKVELIDRKQNKETT